MRGVLSHNAIWCGPSSWSPSLLSSHQPLCKHDLTLSSFYRWRTRFREAKLIKVRNEWQSPRLSLKPHLRSSSNQRSTGGLTERLTLLLPQGPSGQACLDCEGHGKLKLRPGALHTGTPLRQTGRSHGHCPTEAHWRSVRIIIHTSEFREPANIQVGSTWTRIFKVNTIKWQSPLLLITSLCQAFLGRLISSHLSNSEKWVGLVPFYRWENGGSETVSNIHRLLQLESRGETHTYFSMVRFQSN